MQIPPPRVRGGGQMAVGNLMQTTVGWGCVGGFKWVGRFHLPACPATASMHFVWVLVLPNLQCCAASLVAAAPAQPGHVAAGAPLSLPCSLTRVSIT